MAYAEKTMVSEEKSRMEIERLLRRFKATEFGFHHTADAASIYFFINSLPFRITIKLPAFSDFTKTDTGKQRRTANSQQQAYEQEVRRRWRALTEVLKGMLVGVDEGIFSLEQALMGFITNDNGQSLYDFYLPQLDKQRKQPLLEAKKEF